jgi:NADH-quinone oxidoreductase subunit K
MIVPFSHVLILAGLLFLMGVSCVVVRRSLIMILLGVEIMLNASAVLLVGASLLWQNLDGQAIVLFVFAIAAAEVSVGLALIVWAYRQTGSVDPADYNRLK